jgi:hypothetical protein
MGSKPRHVGRDVRPHKVGYKLPRKVHWEEIIKRRCRNEYCLQEFVFLTDVERFRKVKKGEGKLVEEVEEDMKIEEGEIVETK